MLSSFGSICPYYTTTGQYQIQVMLSDSPDKTCSSLVQPWHLFSFGPNCYFMIQNVHFHILIHDLSPLQDNREKKPDFEPLNANLNSFHLTFETFIFIQYPCVRGNEF